MVRAVIALVATDLDRTLIYSRAARGIGADAEAVCVEWYEGEAAGFVTRRARELLVTLAQRTLVVPVTTRVPAQYSRVVLPVQTPFAVVANGGVLLVDGRPDPDWSAIVAQRVLSSAGHPEVFQHLHEVCDPAWTTAVRDAIGLFCYAVVCPDAVPRSWLAELLQWASERGWVVSQQGRKLYCLPTGVTKSAAVAEVARRVGAPRVLAAGDSLLDLDLLLFADRAVVPRHGELFDRDIVAPIFDCTPSTGIRAGEEILLWFGRELDMACEATRQLLS